MLVNSRKATSRRWTVCLALLAVLALSSCKKADEPTASDATPAGGESSTPANSTTAGGDKTATTSSTPSSTTTSSTPSSTTGKTLPPEIEKLGVKPTGTDCPSSAPIKGNVRKAKKIYHEATSKGYKAVKPEICFADAATAKKAGFEAPKGNKPQ